MRTATVLWSAALCLCSLLPVRGLDLMLNNGQVLNDVTILSKNQYGVNVSANQGNDTVILQDVQYQNLTPDSMRHLQAYLTESALELGSAAPQDLMNNPQALDTLTVPQGLSSNPGGNPPMPGQQVDQNTVALTPPIQPAAPSVSVLPPNAQSFSNTVNLNPAENQPITLPGMPHRIYFNSIIVLLNGSLGFAQSADPGVDMPINYGKLYVYGILIPQGGIWVGNIYPTGKNILHRGMFYPCYATNISLARRIAASAQY